MIMAKRKAKVWLSTGSLFGLEDKKPNIIFISWFPKSNIGFFVHINISSHLWQLYTFFVFYYTFEFNFHYHIENYHIFTMFENHPKEADFQTVSFVSQTFKRAKQIPNARVLLSEESLLLPRVTLSTSSLSHYFQTWDTWTRTLALNGRISFTCCPAAGAVCVSALVTEPFWVLMLPPWPLFKTTETMVSPLFPFWLFPFWPQVTVETAWITGLAPSRLVGEMLATWVKPITSSPLFCRDSWASRHLVYLAIFL